MNGGTPPAVDGEPPGHREGPAVLFDGVCNLCNGAVNLLIDRDPEGLFQLASLQSEAAGRLLARAGLERHYLESLVLVERGQVWRRSDAVLEIARRLGRPWSLLGALRAVPRPLRDALYDRVAANRYRWFGKRDACRLPTPELERRFLGS